MPPILVELRPNRRLLDHEFDGYKLNLSALPHWSFSLESPTDKVHPDDTQYSFLHTKLFALHNHLIDDQWSGHYQFYYIDGARRVCKIHFNCEYHTFTSSTVYTIPVHEERKCGHFNISVKFPSRELALISDGTGHLHIVGTGPRGGADAQWQTEHSALLLGENKYFVIIDCRMQELESGDVNVHCLVQSVEQQKQTFNSVLTWVTYGKVEKQWKQVAHKQLEGKGIVHYAAIESTCQALYIATDYQFKFLTENGEQAPPTPAKAPNIVYTWLETMEDINICLKLPQAYDKSLLHVKVTPHDIEVSYADVMQVKGNLHDRVYSELTTWHVEQNGTLSVLLTKRESAIWACLFDSEDPTGQQIMDPSLVERAHQQLSHLCSETEVEPDKITPGISDQQLEECDAASDEDTTLVRIDAVSHKTTHKVPLTVHLYLFHINFDPNQVPMIALRHDVDACLWQPYAKLADGEQWLLQHHGSLSAFGYVQSSKENRKFITCPPNFSYSIVCEASRHVFIYKNIENGMGGCQLRRRNPDGNANNVTVGHQHVFNIDKYGQVLGVHATNSHLFILTETNMVAIQIV